MATKTARYEMRTDPEKLAAWKEAATAAGLSLPEWLERAADLLLEEDAHEHKASHKGAKFHRRLQ